MKAIQFYAPEDIRYEEVPIQEPKKGEVLVKIMAALTCGTDVKTFRRGHPVLIKSVPSGFGHEFSGIVAKLGEGVTNIKVGDRVVAANSAPCGECFFCKKGQYNLCENLQFLNGAYAEYITVPARIVEKNMIKLPDDLSFEEAAFTEPLANVVHGAERTNIKAGQSVGIIGIGPIGLMFAKYAKLKGARVIVGGRNEIKLRLAKEFADVDKVVDLKNTENFEEVFRNFSDEKRGLDVAIECVGLPEMWEKTFSLVRAGGTVHFFGGCKKGSEIKLPTTKMHYGDINILSVFHHTPEYVRKALDIIATHKMDVKKLITEEISLDKIPYAMQQHIEGKAIKFLVKP